MEPRKLIRLGNSSFAIALPKDWIEKSGLKKGDDVFLERNPSGEIILSSQFKKANQDIRKTINIDDKDERKIKRELTSAYIAGCYIIEFAGTINKVKSRIIKNLIKDFVGCEVIEEAEKKIIVKDFFNFEDLNINNFIKRIDNNLQEMFDIIIKAVEDNKISKQDFEDVAKIDADINKFYFLNSRIMTIGLDNPALVNQLKMQAIELFNSWWLTYHLEKAGDNIKAIAERIKTEDISPENRKLLLPLLRTMKDKYKDSLKIFYTKDKNLAYESIELGKIVLKNCEELSKNKNAFLGIVGEKLKELNNNSYQIVKMVSNLKD